MPDRLEQMFQMQDLLERRTTGNFFSDLATYDESDEMPGRMTVTPQDIRTERISQFKEMTIAGWREGVEQLDEMGSKPWATSEHWNVEAVKKELIDEWHFFMAKCLLAGLTPQELYEKYKSKWAVNIHRQANGYDGVSTKCPKCKRALDDDETQCTLLECSEEKTYGD